jgi:glutathione S-transferase
MPATDPRLIIGNKSWSSWSLRPWLVMKRFAIPFEEVAIKLRQPDSKTLILAYSPAGKVPALLIDGTLVWDSLAIIEYLADRHPDKPIWPREREARAIARCVSAEMHSGFQALREHCPMDLFATKPMVTVPEAVEHNLRRIIDIWKECRSRYGQRGPFLFSDYSAADAMFAPICSRLRTYIPDLTRYGDDGTAAAYVNATFATPELVEWAEGARREST